MSPPKFLPNLSTDGQENATYEAKNTKPHAPIPKPANKARADRDVRKIEEEIEEGPVRARATQRYV